MRRESFSIFGRMGKWCWRVAPKVGVGLLVLLALVAIPWTYFNIKWGRELEAKLAELKAQGMPLTLAEAAPKPVPDEENAAVLYQKVLGEFSSPGLMTERRHIGGITEEEHYLIADYIKTGRAARRQIREILSRPAVKRDLQLIRRASERPYSVFPINWEAGAGTLFPHLARLRSAAQMLRIQALVSAEAGRLDEALDWCRVSLRMSQHAASEPTVIGQLVAIAMQAITLDAVEQIVSATDIHPALAHEFEQDLRQIDLYDTFTAAMVAERGGCRELFDELPQKRYKFSYDFGLRPCPLSLRLYASWLGSPVQKLDQLTYLKYMGGVIEATKLPYREAGPKIEGLGQEMAMMPSYLVVTRLLRPIFSKATQRRDHAVASIGLCRAVLALKAYKYERGGYPETLDQLERTLDWKLPEDPFSGQDFVYQRRGEGFMVYSLWSDLDDDGGQPIEEHRYQDGDIVWECSR